MRRSRLALAALIPIVALALAAGVAYVSLLGENNKIDELTQAFFQEIGGGGRGEATAGVRVDAPPPVDETSDSLFLLRLSLLEHYGLLNRDAFEVTTRKDRLWIPFRNDGRVRVSISLRKKPGEHSFMDVVSRIGSSWSSDRDRGSIENLLTVRRRNGNWVIESVNIKGSIIEKTYEAMREKLRTHRYVVKTPQGFLIREVPVSIKALDAVDRLILLHVLQKAQAQLEGPPVAPASQKVLGVRIR
jgi:hypothetical protein